MDTDLVCADLRLSNYTSVMPLSAEQKNICRRTGRTFRCVPMTLQQKTRMSCYFGLVRRIMQRPFHLRTAKRRSTVWRLPSETNWIGL